MFVKEFVFKVLNCKPKVYFMDCCCGNDEEKITPSNGRGFGKTIIRKNVYSSSDGIKSYEREHQDGSIDLYLS